MAKVMNESGKPLLSDEAALLPNVPRRTMSEQLQDYEAQERAHLDSARDVKGFALAMMVYRSIGVIFGDLGTSPMYIFPSIFDHPPSKADALGALSLIIWTLTLLALVKYVLIVLWANDNGEGGTISLYSLLCQEAKIGFEYRTHRSDKGLARLSTGPNLARRSMFVSPSNRFKNLLERSSALKRLLFVVVILGTSAVIADGILTPGVSVLSAVEGLRVAIPSMPQGAVVLVTVFILLLIFSAQQFGTDKVGAAFAPILLLWLAGIAGVGVFNIVKHHPAVLVGLSPHHGAVFLARNKFEGWKMLGGVLLCVTGTEAMFADLGHFNIPAIQISFSLIAFPCLVLQYLGQTAFLISHPESFTNTFWSAIPNLIFWPMFVIGTLAAIVASQALITGVFSISNQLMSLNCLPPLKIKHTSTAHYGQIFVPVVNYFLMTLTIAIVLLFQSSTNLSSAYGVAVTMDMLTTTGLVTLVMIIAWQLPVVVAVIFLLFFGIVELAFFSSTLLKIPNGGWFPIVVAAVLTSLQYIWNWGQRLKSVSNGEQHVPVDEFFAEGENELRLLWSDTPIPRVPGVGFVFSTANPGLPPVLQHFVRNVPALHDVMVLISVRQVPVSTVLPTERILVAPLEGFTGLYRAVVRFGYNDLTDLGDGFAQEINASIYRICEVDESFKTKSVSEKESDSREGSLYHYMQSEPDTDQLKLSGGVTFDTSSSPSGGKTRDSYPAGSLVRHSVSSALVRGSVLASIRQSEDREESHWTATSLERMSQPATSFRDAATSPGRGDFWDGSSAHLTRMSMPVNRGLARISYTGGPRLIPDREDHRRHPWPQLHTDSPREVVIHEPSYGDHDRASQSEHRKTGVSPHFQMSKSEKEDGLEDSDSEMEDVDQQQRIHHVRMQGAVYIVGRSNVRCRRNASFARRILLEKVYATVHNNFQEWASSMNIPQDRLMEVGMPVEL